MNSLTACLITLNEEHNLPRALRSLNGVADEIVVVDSGSSDRTREIAIESGANVITRSWSNYADQKNFAAAAATHDWILSLDADEELSPELRQSLCHRLCRRIHSCDYALLGMACDRGRYWEYGLSLSMAVRLGFAELDS